VAATRGSRGSLALSDVFLLTADSNGQVAVPGLALMLDRSGLRVRKPDGTVAAAVPWGEVTELNGAGRMRTPAGSPGVVLEAVTVSRTHRFVVPSADPDRLEGQILRVAGRRRPAGAASGARRSSGALLGVLMVLVAAVIVLVVLLALGTVKF
jgi:hypothetical protein